MSFCVLEMKKLIPTRVHQFPLSYIPCAVGILFPILIIFQINKIEYHLLLCLKYFSPSSKAFLEISSSYHSKNFIRSNQSNLWKLLFLLQIEIISVAFRRRRQTTNFK